MADAALLKELEPLLRDPKQAADGRIWSFCPAHPDGQKHGNRSLSVHPRYGITCFAGCEFQAILDGLRNGKPQGFNSNGHRDAKGGQLIAIYEYRNEEGVLVAEKCRIEYQDGRKTFKWRLPGGKWEDGLKPLSLRDMPIYGAEVLAKADRAEPVWYVEGEKAQRALALQGFLAVTHGGGAGTKDFGKALEVLRGRQVLLWPDNDTAGRAYMSLVAARLSSITGHIQLFTPPIALPEKGDAYDYFLLGGKPESLQEAIQAQDVMVTEPVVELMAEDAITVTMPTGNGQIRFILTGVDAGARRFDAELEINFGGAEEAYSERVNLLSSSQRTELRRELESLYGKTWDWPRLLNKAFGLARSFYGGIDRSLDVADASAEEGEQLAVDPLFPLDAPTIVFGDGSASKSTQLTALAFAYCAGHPFLGCKTQGQPVLYVDWEDSPAQFFRAIRRLGGHPEILLERGNLFYWPAHGVPLAQQWEAIKNKVGKAGIGLVIYDSISGGCGGPPEDSVVAQAFMNAVHRIGGTSACIAHITKAGQDDKPFGSVMWHNFARRTWLIKRADDDDTSTLETVWICKKINHGRKPKSIGASITFEDPDGLIAIQRTELDVASELFKAAGSLNSRIKQALLRQPMQRPQLAQALDEKEDVLRMTMARHKNEYTQLQDGRWAVRQGA